MIAAPGGKNRVEVTLAFTTDPTQATGGMSKMTAAAKDLSAASKAAQASMSGMRGPGASGGMPSAPNFPSTVAGPGGQRFSYDAYTGAQQSIASSSKSKEQAAAMAAIKGPDKAFSGGLSDLATKGAIAFAAISTLTNGIKALGDVSKGERGKILGVIESVPIVGQAIGGLSRAAMQFSDRGMRRGIAQAEINNPLYEAQQQIRFEGQQKITGARREGEAAIAGARGFFGGGVVVPVAGEDERVTAAKMEETRAKRAADAAAKDLAAFGKELGQSNTGVNVNQRAVDASIAAQKAAEAAAEKQNKRNTTGDMALDVATFQVGRKIAFGGYEGKSSLVGVEEGMNTNKERKDLGRALLTQEEALRTQKEKQLAAEMKMAEYERARTEVLKAQAAVLKDQLATAKAQERTAGSMSDEDKKALLAAAQNAKQRGLGNVSEEERNMLLGSSLTSNFFGKEAEKLGASDPTLQALRGITGEKASGQLGNELKDIAAKIDVKINIDENALAQKMSNIFGKFIENLEMLIKKQVGNSTAQIDTDAEKSRRMNEAAL